MVEAGAHAAAADTKGVIATADVTRMFAPPGSVKEKELAPGHEDGGPTADDAEKSLPSCSIKENYDFLLEVATNLLFGMRIDEDDTLLGFTKGCFGTMEGG